MEQLKFIRLDPTAPLIIPAMQIGRMLHPKKAGIGFERRLLYTKKKYAWVLEALTHNAPSLAFVQSEYPEHDYPLDADSLFMSPGTVRDYLLQSRNPRARKILGQLIDSHPTLYTPEQLDEMKRAAAHRPHRTHKKGTPMSTKKKSEVSLALPSAENLPKELLGPLTILQQMVKTQMFTKEKLEGLYIDLFNRSLELSKAPPKAAEPTFLAPVKKKDATELVPTSNIQASSMTPNFTSIRSFFLTGTQKHPKYPDWISAEEIGAPYGQKADFVKKHIMNYATSRGKDLPNNKARDLVLRNGGYFEGIKSIVDGFKLPCFVDEELGGLGVWYLMEDGKLVWRNYWSPAAVAEIIRLSGWARPAIDAPIQPEQLKFQEDVPGSNGAF